MLSKYGPRSRGASSERVTRRDDTIPECFLKPTPDEIPESQTCDVNKRTRTTR